MDPNGDDDEEECDEPRLLVAGPFGDEDYDSDDPRHKYFPLAIPFDSGPESDYDCCSESDLESCTCKRCNTYRDIRDYSYAEDDEISKVDVYHLSHLLFKVTDGIDLPDSLAILPKLLKKIKEKMIFGLQEDLVGVLYFPGHGYLPHTVVRQIVEMMLESSNSGRQRDLLKFENKTPHIKRILNSVYGNLEELHIKISSEWPSSWEQLKKPGQLCEVKLQCNSDIVINILLMMDAASVLVPDGISFEEEKFRKFLEEINIEQIRARVQEIMIYDMHQTLGKNERKNLTPYIYALRMTYDHVAALLTPHVKTHDIIAMCKIYKI